MRVYICSPFESKMAKRGTRHPRLAEFLCAAGHDVEYVTTNFSHARKEYFDSFEVEHYQCTLPYRLSVLKIFGYYNNISAQRLVAHQYLSAKYFLYLMNRIQKGDVMVLPSRPPELMFAAALLKLIKGVRVVVDIRDIWPDMLRTDSVLKNTCFSFYCNFFQHLSLRWIDEFVHTCPSFTKWLARYTRRKASIFVPLGYDAFRWEGMKPVSMVTKGNPIKLVYVGQLSLQVDLSQLIRAAANNDRYLLTIIGSGNDLPKWESLSKSLKMQNARFTGYVPHEQVVKELKEQHVGLIPMTSYALPNKLFDYIASYLPVLVLGDNDASAFVVGLDIGWRQGFDTKGLEAFFAGLSMDEIVEKSNNISKIRERLSKEYLYRKYADLIAA